MGCLRLNFWLPGVSDSEESIFWFFKYKYLHENSTNFEIAFRHVFWYQDEPSNEKKGSQKISLDCRTCLSLAKSKTGWRVIRTKKLWCHFYLIKGIVQRKVKWVKSNVNQWPVLLNSGAGFHTFFFSIHSPKA